VAVLVMLALITGRELLAQLIQAEAVAELGVRAQMERREALEL